MITQETKLNLIPGGAPPIVHVSQYDVGRTLTFGLVAGSETFNIPTGTAAQIVGTKPDKYGFAYDCTVDIANSSVSVTVEEQMTAVAGNTICEIRLTRSGANIGTANFVLRVEQAALGDDTVVSDSDIALAQQILDELGDYDVYGAALDQALKAATDNATEISVLAARMDTFARLDDGSTTGDAELADARVACNGGTYTNAGGAIRGQAEGVLQNILGDVTLNEFEILPPCTGGKIDTYLTAVKYGKIINIDGSYSGASSVGRFRIYGEFAFRTGSPSYSNVPAWYGAPFDGFVVGHKYKFKIKMISGSYTPATADRWYFDLRTSGGKSAYPYDGDTWTCTFQPEMMCVGIGKGGTFSNAYFFLSIIDETARLEVAKETEAANSPYAVPSYFNNHLTAKIAKINTDINDSKTANYGTDIESFVFLTDVHWAGNKKHSPALINAIMNGSPIKTVICGGDTLNAHADTKQEAVAELREFTDLITQMPCYDYYAVFGNHDDNTNGNSDLSIQMTKEEQYNVLYAPFADKKNVHWSFEEAALTDGANVKNDYYFDHPKTKTRYICIDWNNPFSGQRLAWFTNTLSASVTAGWRIVIIYHSPYKWQSGGGVTPEHYAIVEALADYKDKVVAIFSGHAHIDYLEYPYGDGYFPVIGTACDKYDPTYNVGMAEGTYTEQCFDVAVIDYNASKIKLTRIGNGSDREVAFTLT